MGNGYGLLNQYGSTVVPNRKCESCLHYESNREKGGLCQTGLQPLTCGDGSTPKLSYAPMANCQPEMVDEIVTGAQVGSTGQMNEYGVADQKIPMREVNFHSEQLAEAYNAFGRASSLSKSSCSLHQGGGTFGQSSLSMPTNVPCNCAPVYLDHVAKAAFASFDPALRCKFDEDDFMEFLVSNGVELEKGTLRIKRFRGDGKSRNTIEKPGGAHDNENLNVNPARLSSRGR